MKFLIAFWMVVAVVCAAPAEEAVRDKRGLLLAPGAPLLTSPQLVSSPLLAPRLVAGPQLVSSPLLAPRLVAGHQIVTSPQLLAPRLVASPQLIASPWAGQQIIGSPWGLGPQRIIVG